jgi:hypothetical protein
MDPKAARRLLAAGDPLADGEVVATRLLRIDEAERIREVLRGAGIACQMRLMKRGRVEGSRRDPYLDSEYSTVRPSWNVVVPAGDVARGRALVEEALRIDVDGRDDTTEIAAGEGPRPTPVPLVVLPWDEAWDLVEELGRRGIKAAVGSPLGDGPVDERDAPVLVLPDDLQRATTLVPPEVG